MPKLKSMESQFELRKPVTPYVCSTPGDFHLERDWLTTYVFPRLAEVCQARGTYLSPVDVRWSPDDAVTQNGHLLHLLLDLVKQSSPYFLCLLGETYGPYRPKDSAPISSQSAADRRSSQESRSNVNWLDLNFSLAAKCGHGWVLKDGHQNCSIPELEIIAATVRSSSEQCAFYFRQSEHLEIRFADVPEEEQAELTTPFLPESEHAGLKMQTLRQTIVKKGLPVRYFKSPQELGQIVYDDWIKILDIVYPPLADNGSFLDTAQYTQWAARQALLTQLRANFVSSPAIESVLLQLTEFALSSYDEPPQLSETDFRDTASIHSQSASVIFRQKPQVVTAHYQSILLLSGDRGAGKSVLLARWLREFTEENPDLFLIHCFVGTSPAERDIAAYLRCCIRDLRRHFLLTEVASCTGFDEREATWWSEEDSSTPDDFPSLCQAFVAAASLGPCVLLLDGINDLSATHGMSQQEVKEFEWLPFPLPPHCRIILSTTNADLSYRCLQRRGDVSIIMSPAVGDLSAKMSYLEKCLKPHVAPHVRNRKRQICEMRMLVSPLALCVLGSELNSYNIYTALNTYIDVHCETGSLRTFWASCLQQWILDHSWTRDDEGSVASKDDGLFDYTGWVADALCLLAVSRGGLRQDELLQILDIMGYTGALRVTALHWWQFRMRVGALLWETADCCIRFSHQHLQDFTEYLLLRSVSSSGGDVTPTSVMVPHQASKRKVHMYLARFFSQQPLSRRQLQELPWHLLMMGDWDRLLAYLTHNRVVYMMLAQRDRYPDAHYVMRLYWRALGQRGQMSGPHYLRLLKDLGLYTLSSAFLTQGDAISSSPDQLLRQPTPDVILLKEREVSNLQPGVSFASTPRFLPNTSTVISQADSGFFLTSPELQLAFPHILEGVHGDEKKAVVSSLAWAASQFLVDGHQTTAGTIVLSSLLSYLQANFPLSVETHVLMVRVLERLGCLCLADGDAENAVALYHQALRVTFGLDALDQDTCDHRQVDTCKGLLLGHHGYLQMVGGEVLEAGELLKEATESISHLTGNHTLRATLLYHAGLLRYRLGEYSRSEASLRQALALRLQWHGQNHPEVGEVLLALARVLNTPAYNKQQEPHEIKSLYRRALSVSERCLSAQHVQVSQILLELGQVLAAECSRQSMMEARDLLQRSLDMRTTALGADDASTRAARQSVRRVEVALQLGLSDGAHTARRTNMLCPPTKHSARSVRRAHTTRTRGHWAELGAYMDIRSVSRESVLRHNRPDSIMSAYSLMSASERLLASRPQSSLPSRVKVGGSRVTSATSSMGGRANLSVGWSAKSPFLTEAPLDVGEIREDAGDESREKREDGIPDTGPRSTSIRLTGASTEAPVKQLVVDLGLGQQQGAGDECLVGQSLEDAGSKTVNIPEDTPRLDSFAVHLEDGTILIGERRPPTKQLAPNAGRKRVTVRPTSAPRRLFQRYAAVGTGANTSNNITSVKQRPASQRSAYRSRSWSAHSGVTSVGSTGSHMSRCRVPGAHDIHPSNARSLHGPHSDISSLLGSPPCPRESVVTATHHRSAFYHVPGRYPTGIQRYPPRRSQKTEGARVIESVLSIKLAQAKPLREMIEAPPGFARAPSLGVNQQDVDFLVRQTDLNRPGSRGGAILTSARATPAPDEPASNIAPVVKFREPIAVS